MKKILSVMMVLIFLTGGTAWARHKKGDSTNSASSHGKHSKGHKGKKGKGKKGKGSKAKGEVKMENGSVSKGDLEIDLKGQ